MEIDAGHRGTIFFENFVTQYVRGATLATVISFI